MFDVSLVELAVIALVALLVLGPERLPRAARTVGLYVRKARQSWYSVRADIERELAADELKRSMERNRDSVQSSLGFDGLREELRGVHDDLRGRPKISPPRAAVVEPAAASNESLPEQSEAPDAALPVTSPAATVEPAAAASLPGADPDPAPGDNRRTP